MTCNAVNIYNFLNYFFLISVTVFEHLHLFRYIIFMFISSMHASMALCSYRNMNECMMYAENYFKAVSSSILTPQLTDEYSKLFN